MRKNLISKIIISLIIITLVVLIPIAYIFIHSCHENEALQTDSIHSALVLDYNLQGNYTEKAILNNRGALIGLQADHANTENVDVFNSLGSLNSLDANKDGRLDEKDPMFSHLMLVFLDQQGKQHIVTLKQAGITTIVFQKKIANIIASIDSNSEPILGYAETIAHKKINMVLVQDKNAMFN